MNTNKNNNEKLNVANVEPFPKLRYAELAVYLAAVIIGLVYLYAPNAIPTSVMLVVFSACILAAAVIRFIWIKRSGTRRLSTILLTVLLAVCAVMTVIAAVMYFLSRI